MAGPRISDVDYQEFLIALRKAADAGHRIDATEKDRWGLWVKTHRVREAAFKSVGGSRFEGLKSVIIDDPGPSGGYYLYSQEEEACLKWVSTDSTGD